MLCLCCCWVLWQWPCLPPCLGLQWARSCAPTSRPLPVYWLPPLPQAGPYVALWGGQTSSWWSCLLPLLLLALGLQGLHPWTGTFLRWFAIIVFALAIFLWSSTGDSARFAARRFCSPMQLFGPWWLSYSPTILRPLPSSSPWCLSQCHGQQGRFKTCQGWWSRQ